MDLPLPLRAALDTALAGAGLNDLAGTVAALIERYQAGGAADAPILAGEAEALAYAGYRMPATYAAVRSALNQLTGAVPQWRPASLLDLGGGTGAAAWAVTGAFPQLHGVTVVDQAVPALAVGQRLAEGSTWDSGAWEQVQLTGYAPPATDFITISYVLGELTGEEQDRLVTAAAEAAVGVVLVVEPGTPAGYRRVLAARERLLAAGMTVLAPCPHHAACPITGRDWCHFAVRVGRTSVHRRLKQAELGYEDEPFAYVAAGHPPAVGPINGAPASRVLRRPQQRKGLVSLRLCTVDATAVDEIVSKRQGDRYRAARDLTWGDTWSPPNRQQAVLDQGPSCGGAGRDLSRDGDQR